MTWHQLTADLANLLSISLSIAAIWHVRMSIKNQAKQALKNAKEQLHD